MPRNKNKTDDRKEMIASLESTAPASPPASTIPVRLTSVGIVEDNLGLRRSLERLLLQSPGMKCVGAWADAQSALKQLPALAPDVVLMDINLPGMNGIECTAKLRVMLPKTHVVMVTVYEDTDSIFKALKAGASGYLLKRASAHEILEAICDVRAGGSPMTSEIARKVVHAFREPPPEQASGAVLSAREQEILELVAQGFANKEIADKLQISYNTVKVHNKNIYEKLHVRSRTEVVLKFMADRGNTSS